MAVLTAAFPPAVMHIGTGVGMSLLLQLLREGCSISTALGNASLCIGDLAKQPELLPILSRHDAVAPLLGMLTYQQGHSQARHGFRVIYSVVPKTALCFFESKRCLLARKTITNAVESTHGMD